MRWKNESLLNLSFNIARRYLFAKKTTNAINIITGISVLGISIGTAALVLVLSVFNGFEDLITSLFGHFNPDVKVTIAKGKFFEPDSSKIARIESLDGVAVVSKTVEEVAFFEYRKNQDFGILKGVDEAFKEVTGIDSTVFEGAYRLKNGDQNMLVIGGGMRNKLAVNVGDEFEFMQVYMAKRKKARGLDQQFRKRYAYPVGSFKIQQDFDYQYILSSLEFAQDLLGFDTEIGALEIKLNPSADPAQTIAQIKEIMGPDFLVKDRFEQNEAFLKLMNVEKWMFFALFAFMLILVAFNLIGALWMIVLEKKKDIAILKSMGATDQLVRRIFLNEGLIICFLGMGTGFLLAIGLYLLQVYYGFIAVPDGFVVNAYPVSMRFGDFLWVGLTVFIIGLLAALPPAWRAQRIPAMIREE
ncbi:MAG: FtsX-like permease family protein [Bacteroidetes bacterium]|nr:MAG: FtsX-like permease family protein [Bacteroidota bacterium]